MTTAPAPAPATPTPRMKLDIETRQLQRSWREFNESLRSQDEQQQRHQKPDDLVREIKEDIQYWSSHRQRVLFQKAIKWAQKCLGTMPAHTELMETLPDSKYSELFFGVVYSIVKATKEQYRVAEAFLKFLAKINDAVASAVDKECPTEQAAALYGRIFLFLGEFLREYVSKAQCRLLYSHNEDFKSNFKNLVTSVENLAFMRLESACADSSCANYMPVDNAHYFEKIGLEGAARKHASQTTTVLQLIWNTRQQKILNEKLAADQARILNEFVASLRAQVHRIDVDGECHSSGTSVVHPQTRQAPSSEATPKRRLLKVILQQDSSPLQDFFDNSEQIYPFGPDQPLEISAPLATALFDWSQTNPSLPLAIAGSAELTLVSACYIFVARKHNIPVISHFCASSPRASKKDALIALVYSLIRQLIELAPPMLNCDSNCDLSGERFRRLDGTIGSWADALSILDTLLHYKPPVLFCVIDALDILGGDGVNDNDSHNHNNGEQDQTEEYVKSLVSTLASHTQPTVSAGEDSSSSSSSAIASSPCSPSSSGLLKVLFTTTGPCHAIQSTLVGQELGQVITTETMDTQTQTIYDDGDTIMTEG